MTMNSGYRTTSLMAVVAVAAGFAAGEVRAQQSETPPAAQPATPPSATPPPPTPLPPTTQPPAKQPPAAGTTAQPAQPPTADQPASVPEVEVIQKQDDPPQPEQAAEESKPRKKVTRAPTPPAQQPKPAAVPAPQPTQGPVDLAPASIEPVASESVQGTAAARAAGSVVPMSPAGGAEIEVKKYPGGVSSTSGGDLARNPSSTAQDVLQKSVPGAILTDASGSAFRSQLEYRGFGAGSLNGFPQGIAVYQNGVRINEVFGDVVNWDLIPSNAINDITILSGNPVYGLNAIGGGASILMKDGFSFEGVEIDIMGGSFGRKEIGAQVGMRSGPFALYWAGEALDEDGFRDFSPASIERMYMDLGAKGSVVEAHINLTWSDSSAGVATASPEDILDIGWERTFTTPQITDLNVVMPSLNLAVKATDTLTLSGLAYYRRYKSRIIDGNLGEFEECGDVAADLGVALPPGVAADDLCAAEEDDVVPLQDKAGNNIPVDDVGEEPFGVLDRINQDAKSWGGTIQAVEKADVFGLKNQFLVGSSFDRGQVSYSTSSEIGTIGKRYVVTGSGIILDQPDDFTPRGVDVATEYFGVYFSNTLDLTDQIALTVGGRYNSARIELLDVTGDFPEITSNHFFERFNPSAGATYEFLPGISLYGGYSEANRAPTPAELACANPENPCPIESFLTDDPPLKQVVTKSYEFGLRGDNGGAGGQTLKWNLGYFHALNTDDILFVSSGTTGRGFFLNAGDTLREGFEAGIEYANKVFSAYANYSFISATYETPLELSSPNNPLGGPCIADPDATCINVSPGDSIPGIPEHRFKTGFDLWITRQWKFGGDLIYATGQHYLGDEANLLPKLPGYTRVDLHTSYDISENFQIYGLVNNVFDQRYGLFGTLFDPEEATEAGEPSGYQITSPFGFVPAAPVAGYGGIRMKF
ncbi:MAG: TonB-dependent receptor domain-containing protein [Hyphomicrobium sp.]